MIGYVTLGSKDVKTAALFYDELFNLLGADRIYDAGGYVAWAIGNSAPMFSITEPYDKQPATVGNGTMIALQANSQKQVDQLHATALALGAENEGDPGIRSGGYYCAYFRDLDGNKLNFHCPPQK